MAYYFMYYFFSCMYLLPNDIALTGDEAVAVGEFYIISKGKILFYF